MSEPSIYYIARPEATPESELSTLAAIYRIVLSADEWGRLPDKSSPDDAERSLNDGARNIIQDTK